MNRVLIKTDPQEWRRFIANLQSARATMVKLKRTTVQAQRLRAALKDFGSLKSMIQTAFVEWVKMQQQEMPPLEAKIDAMQELVDTIMQKIADTLHSRVQRISKIINEAATLLAPQEKISPQPEDAPPTKIRPLPKLRLSPAIAWKRRLATCISDLSSATSDIRDVLLPHATWQAILGQSANCRGPHHKHLVAAAVRVWRETDGVGLRHVYDAVERYSGLSPNAVALVLEGIEAETLHERIWNSLLKLVPEGEEVTHECIATACEAFIAKYPEVDWGVVLEVVRRFGEVGKDDTEHALDKDSGRCGLQ